MRGFRTYFYADKSDMEAVFKEVLALGDFKFTRCYWDEIEGESIYYNPFDIPDYWISEGPAFSCPGIGYIVTHADDRSSAERYTIKTTGVVRYKADNGTHPSSIRLSLGGDAGDNTLICSLIDTLAYNDEAKTLFKRFSNVITKLSLCKPREHVLPGALELYKQGWRLTRGKDMAASQDVPSISLERDEKADLGCRAR